MTSLHANTNSVRSAEDELHLPLGNTTFVQEMWLNN